MKSILGKIAIFLSLLLKLFGNGVSVDVSSPIIYKGDILQYTITIEGGKYKFPNITQIAGYDILGISTSSSTTIINGDITKKVSKIYTLKPLKSITIPTYTINIDGKTYYTKELKVKVIKPTKSKKGDDFVIELKSDNTKLKVGQSTKLHIIFKQKIGSKADKLKINEPILKDFWVKRLPNEDKKFAQSEYIVQEFIYKIRAKKAGKFTIDTIEGDIGYIVKNRQNNSLFNDPFFNDPFFSSIQSQIKWKKIYSNSLNIEVEELPQNIEIFGDYKLKVYVDKKEVYANKPINLTIDIQGNGNIDDIKKFEINIPQAIAYSDEPKITDNQFIQKIAIIANNDFTIPSISFKYFDKHTQKIKILKSNLIKIKVKGSKKEEVKIEKINNISSIKNTTSKSVIKNQDNAMIITKQQLKYIFGIIAIILIILSIIYIYKKIKQSKKQSNIIIRIKKAKTDKELYEVLLPYAKDNKTITEILEKLERNIYKNEKIQINKQQLYDIFL